MPYAFLVSALGAITSTAIAMFGIRAWSAMEIAPVVGAVIGFAVGVVTLRLRELPLSASLEEYTAAGKGGSLQVGAPLYLKVAINVAIFVSMVEAPILLISKASAPVVLSSGWIVISAWTFYRVWRLNTESLLNNDLGVFKLVGGLASLGFACGAVYFAYMGLPSAMADDSLTVIKFGFIANPFAALGAAVIAVFGMYAICQFAELINPQGDR